jgi:predicted transcriptional regulator
MKKVETRIKTSFGEIIVEGENPQEILDLLSSFPEDFMEKVSNFVASRVTVSGAQLKGIVESTPEGPVIVVSRDNLTHYEAIGLIMYASENRKNTASRITKLLESSGIKCMVPGRLNEMTKKGLVFKPDMNKPEFKLTMQGEKWIEDTVLAKLRGKMG